VQRRRKRKAEPRNVFGSGSQPKTSKKESVRSKERLTKPKIQPLPPPVPGLKPKPSVIPDPPLPEPEDDAIAEPIVLVDQTPKAEDSSSTVVLEEQLLGDSPRRPLGLSKSAPAPEPEVIERISTTSEKAKELIESSKARASAHVETPPKSNAPAANALPKPQIKPRRKFRSRVRSYQPAARARRLDRSRHMEYKYEMRLTLSDIGIPEEHRSNLLATIWARGERQSINESKEFLNEKLQEDVIDDEQRQILEKIVDGYTVRR
tara:strand:- start:861 stop:1649 length:789 start_codon:yes stop_codon:yes gene_type:complete